MRTPKYTEQQKRALYERIMSTIETEIWNELSNIDETENVDEGIGKNLAVGAMAALSMLGGKAKAENVPSQSADQVKTEIQTKNDFGKAQREEIVDLTNFKGTKVLSYLNAIYQEYSNQKHDSYLGWGNSARSRDVISAKDYVQGQFKGGDQIVQFKIGTSTYQILIPKDVEVSDSADAESNITALKSYLKEIKTNSVNSLLRADLGRTKVVTAQDFSVRESFGRNRRVRRN